jgi:uncharacterized protein YcbX
VTIGRITGIRRYPVKSMAGEELEQVGLGENGLPGDRAWAVRDEVRGGIRGGKKIPALMTCAARYEKPPADTGSSPAEIELPDGSRISTSDADAGARISEAVGHEVTLWPLMPADAVDHYLRGAPTHEDMEQELRAIFARQPDEPLPDLSIFPPEILQYESPPGTYFDAFPLLVMSEQSLAQMASVAPESRFDVRRFRPNLIVDAAGDDPFPEQAWRGKRIRVGTAVVEITVACPRCVMTTHGFDDLAKDPKVMRALVANAEGNLGVYAKVAEPGELRVGDEIEVEA